MPSLKALALIAVVAISLIWLLNSNLTAQKSKDATISTTESKKSNKAAQEAVNITVKEQQQPDAQKTTTNANTSVTNQIPIGIDPFKEFLEKQKQNSKDQVVSPFGKN